MFSTANIINWKSVKGLLQNLAFSHLKAAEFCWGRNEENVDSKDESLCPHSFPSMIWSVISDCSSWTCSLSKDNSCLSTSRSSSSHFHAFCHENGEEMIPQKVTCISCRSSCCSFFSCHTYINVKSKQGSRDAVTVSKSKYLRDKKTANFLCNLLLSLPVTWGFLF